MLQIEVSSWRLDEDKKLHVMIKFTWSKNWIWISIIKWNIKRLLVVLRMGL